MRLDDLGGQFRIDEGRHARKPADPQTGQMRFVTARQVHREACACDAPLVIVDMDQNILESHGSFPSWRCG
jgi:hypothetical protein